jgi:hypothetical protein
MDFPIWIEIRRRTSCPDSRLSTGPNVRGRGHLRLGEDVDGVDAMETLWSGIHLLLDAMSTIAMEKSFFYRE